MPKLYGDLGMITVKKHGMRIMKSKKKTNKRRMKRHGSKLRMKKGIRRRVRFVDPGTPDSTEARTEGPMGFGF